MRFFTRISSYFLVTIFAILFGCCVTIAVLGALEWRRMNITKATSQSVSIVDTLRPETYQESLVITSVSTSSKTIIAQVRSTTAGQFIPTIFHYNDDLEVTRRDVVVENGVIVGLTETTPKSVDDLLPGTHGVGTILITKDGSILLRRILIGDPLPRP